MNIDTSLLFQNYEKIGGKFDPESELLHTDPIFNLTLVRCRYEEVDHASEVVLVYQVSVDKTFLDRIEPVRAQARMVFSKKAERVVVQFINRLEGANFLLQIRILLLKIVLIHEIKCFEARIVLDAV